MYTGSLISYGLAKHTDCAASSMRHVPQSTILWRRFPSTRERALQVAICNGVACKAVESGFVGQANPPFDVSSARLRS